MKRDDIDFEAVPQHQQAMHDRLLNWGRWCNGKPGPSVAPMFRQYRPDKFEVIYESREPISQQDAGKIQSAVVLLCLQ